MENARMQQATFPFICNSSSSPGLQLQIFLGFFFFHRKICCFVQGTHIIPHSRYPSLPLTNSFMTTLQHRQTFAMAMMVRCRQNLNMHTQDLGVSFISSMGLSDTEPTTPKLRERGGVGTEGWGRGVCGEITSQPRICTSNILTQIKARSQLLHLHR